MHDVLGPNVPDSILGYCTNVHAGVDYQQMRDNLARYAPAVKAIASPDQPMGVGLWFSAQTAREMVENETLIAELRDWLGEQGLIPYTLNGFPYGDFHSQVVKHKVYQPDWSTPERVRYTIALALILAELLPEGAEGSVSTLPIGWNDAVNEGWADHLAGVVEGLEEIEDETGRMIHLDLEPEPGCELSTTQEVLMLMMTAKTFSGVADEVFHRYLRICLDVCHQAVMFEPATMMLEWLRNTGFNIGKVQLSSAVVAPFRGCKANEKKAMREQLERFVEPRYLHQTTIGRGNSIQEFYDDLPDALTEHPRGNAEWRVHFHVPVFLEKIGALETTRSRITELLRAIKPEDNIHHFEVETYAWDVLPEDLRGDDLAAGIARELTWVREAAAQRPA